MNKHDKDAWKQLIKAQDIDLSRYGYLFKKELSIGELFSTFSEHRRLKVFANKSTQCIVPDCKNIGTRLIVGVDALGNQHVDLYTHNLIMMTIDHILPKARGGGNEMRNLQTMCIDHNCIKGKLNNTDFLSAKELHQIPFRNEIAIDSQVNTPDGIGFVISYASRNRYLVQLNGCKRHYPRSKVFELSHESN